MLVTETGALYDPRGGSRSASLRVSHLLHGMHRHGSGVNRKYRALRHHHTKGWALFLFSPLSTVYLTLLGVSHLAIENFRHACALCLGSRLCFSCHYQMALVDGNVNGLQYYEFTKNLHKSYCTKQQCGAVTAGSILSSWSCALTKSR